MYPLTPAQTVNAGPYPMIKKRVCKDTGLRGFLRVDHGELWAHLSNGVLFVVGAEMTSRYAAARALEQLQNARTRPIGAVLNRVDLKHNAYYYSSYYRREYGAYYGAAEA